MAWCRIMATREWCVRLITAIESLCDRNKCAVSEGGRNPGRGGGGSGWVKKEGDPGGLCGADQGGVARDLGLGGGGSGWGEEGG